MENTDESHASVNELLPGMNQIVCDNSPSVGMGPDYDLQQSNLALLKAELKLVTHDRDLLKKELSKIQHHLPPTPLSASYNFSGTLPRSTYSQPLSSVRDYDALQRQCEAAMSELQSLKRQHDRCEKAVQESEYYRGQHRSVLSKLDSTTQEMHTLIAKYGDVLTGKQRLEQEIHSLSQAREEDRKEINDLRRQQQEAVIKGNGTNETLNQLYVNTLRKCEAIKDEHDSLRKRYADLVASHSAAVSKLELAQEEMTRLKKQYEESIQERNAAVRERNVLKSQCTHAIMQWDIAIRERNTYMDYLTKIQLQHEEEVNKGMAVKIKSSKDLKRLTEERNAAMEEYSLVMRERDSVHKEIEKLQDDLMQSNKKLKALESKSNEILEEKDMLFYQVESLRREIKSALDDRDNALKELHEMRESGEFQEPRWNETLLEDQERTRFGLGNGCLTGEQLRKDRTEPLKSGRGESCSVDFGEQEVEQFKKQLEKIQTELVEALQEAEVSKQRRDWAFGERDKVVLERESIRTLCDRLRRERDRAVSDLAEALRDSDDIKRQRNEATKEVKELKEKLGDIQLEKEKDKEKETRAPLNHSYDSALGTDFSDGDTDTLDIELDWSGCLMGFGFSLAGGKSRPVYNNDYGLYVVSIARGGPAEGKLKINDCLIKIGTRNCTAVDCDSVLNLLRSAKLPVVLTVKRRRCFYQGLYSVKLTSGCDLSHGLSLENGIYIRSVTPGSIVARESSLKAGDRLCSINGKILDPTTSSTEVYRVLNDSNRQNDGPTITVIRGSLSSVVLPVSLPSLGSPSSSSSAHNITEEEGQIDVQIQSKVDGHFTSVRRHQGGKHSKVSSLSSNAPSNVSSAGSIASAGLVVWDMFRETLGRPRRPLNKDKSNHPEDGKCSLSSTPNNLSSSGQSTDREAAAIAVLEDVIDRYSPLKTSNPMDSASNAGNHKKKSELNSGLVTLSRRKRIMGNTNHSEAKCDDTRMSNGGTWPRCRAGSPFVSGEYLDGTNTLFHSYKYPRARLPLSVFIDASKTSKDEAVVEDTTDDDKDSSQIVPNGDFRGYEDCASIETVDPPSDGSIDLSVQSGNLGKEDLGRYLKKKGNTSCGTACKSDVEAEVCRSSQLTPASTNQTLTTAGGGGGLSTAGPLHIHSALPSALPTHLRIQSQLYPATIHSSLKYKVSPHVGHIHSHPHNLSPPRYSSPPPLPRPSSESPYDFPLGGPHSLLLNKSYSHTQSPSIDSAYSRPHNHNHNHSSVASPFGYDSNRNTNHAEYVQPPYTETPGTSKKEPARIRIPSNPSVTSRNSIGRMSSSSVERLSEHGSPMPNFHVEILSPGRPNTGVGSRSSIDEYSWTTRSGSKFKPAPDELRRVYIEKSSEPLGIQIFCRNSGGVFVSSVHQSSLAAQVGLQVGDQLLEVCGINMRSATYQLAACVLHQCGNSITMLVQYNPTKYQELQELSGMSLMGPLSVTSSSSECDGNREESHQRSSNSRSGSPTPCNSPRHSRDHSNNSGSGSNPKADTLDPGSTTLRSPMQYDRLVDRGGESRSSIVRPPSIHGTLTRHHALATLKRPTSMTGSGAGVEDSNSNIRDREPRLVYLEMKKAHSLGISLVGGNAVGIFVHSVQNDSPAFKAGLRCGDRILEFNGVNLRESTAEQAAYELAKPTEKVTLIVQYDLERYQEIAEQPGDSFYVRAQFDKMAYDSHEQMELCFRRDDILHIDNTMFNGVPGLWRAWLVDSDGRKIRCGVIPSKYKIEEELQRSSLADLDHESRRSSTSARRSFFRRRKHTRSSSRDSKEIASFSDSSLQPGSAEVLGLSTSVYVQEAINPRPVSYAQVERYDCKETRPVIIVGPLSDYVVDKLVQEFPRKFIRVMPELMPYPESFMEKNLEENNFVEYRRKGTHYECITVTAVQEVGEKNLHGLLDIPLNAVSRLHNRRCFPIIILLKFKSIKHVREVKDTRLPTDKTAAKAVKEMYEHVIKIEAEHKQLISAVIQAGGNLACLCTQVAATVDQEQAKILWVPQGSIW